MSVAFPPAGWARCDGQLLPINQNMALFSLLGTTYGGDGQTMFALPDLRGRTPIHRASLHWGDPHALGGRAGEQEHSLTLEELPRHVHAVHATAEEATTNTPGSEVMLATAAGEGARAYAAPQNMVVMDPTSAAVVGEGQPHDNMQPFLTLNFCIALTGIYPTRD